MEVLSTPNLRTNEEAAMDNLIVFLISPQLSLTQLSQLARVNKSLSQAVKHLPEQQQKQIVKNSDLDLFNRSLLTANNIWIKLIFEGFRWYFEYTDEHFVEDQMRINKRFVWALLSRDLIEIDFLLKCFAIEHISLDELFLIFCTLPKDVFCRFRQVVKHMAFEKDRYTEHEELSFGQAAERWKEIVPRGYRPTLYTTRMQQSDDDPLDFFERFSYFSDRDQDLHCNDRGYGGLYISMTGLLPKLISGHSFLAIPVIAKSYGVIPDDRVLAVAIVHEMHLETEVDDFGIEMTFDNIWKMPQYVEYNVS